MYTLKVRGRKNVFQANGNLKKGGTAMLSIDKTDFETRTTKTKVTT